MSTRGMVLFAEGHGRTYEAYYNHCDSYPTWLGVKLAEMLKGKTSERVFKRDIVKDLKLRKERRHFSGTFEEEAAKQVFNYQGDLEWIYVIRGNEPRFTSMSVFRTSNPDLIHGPDFVFSVWFSYVKYMPSVEDIPKRMTEVERMAEITLNGIAAYHEAANRGKSKPSSGGSAPLSLGG